MYVRGREGKYVQKTKTEKMDEEFEGRERNGNKEK